MLRLPWICRLRDCRCKHSCRMGHRSLEIRQRTLFTYFVIISSLTQISATPPPQVAPSPPKPATPPCATLSQLPVVQSTTPCATGAPIPSTPGVSLPGTAGASLPTSRILGLASRVSRLRIQDWLLMRAREVSMTLICWRLGMEG